MGNGASVPNESSVDHKQSATSVVSSTSSSKSKANANTLGSASNSTPAKKDDAKNAVSNNNYAASPMGMGMGMEEFFTDEAGEKPISNNKLKKMALGIQGYKDKDRDYDQTLAQMDFNKTQNVEWSEPKSPEKVLNKKASKDNVALEMKHDVSSPSLRPYGNSRAMDFSPMSTLQPKTSTQNVLSPGATTQPPRPIGTPGPGIPPGVTPRPFPGNVNGKVADSPAAESMQAYQMKGQIPSQASMIHQQSMGMTTPMKGNIPGTLSSPPSQQFVITPVAGPGNIPVRPFNGMMTPSPSISNNSMMMTTSGKNVAPMMMAIPPNAARGSAPVQVPIGGGTGGPPMMTMVPGGPPPQMVLGPNGIPMGAIPIGAMPMGTMPMGTMSMGTIPMGAIPMGAMPMNVVSISGNNLPPGLVPASPAGVIATGGPAGLGPRGPPSSGGAGLPVVKETKDVKRNKAQLPSNLTHAKPTTGDWLNKRYIVNNYILLDVLGTGSYGEVRLCKDRTTERLYAIKIISKDFLKKRKNGKTTETYFEDIKREIAIMKKLLHPNILRLYEVLDDPKVNKMYLVLEYMKKGDLINILKKRDGANEGDFQPLSDFEVWQIFRQLVTGIRYLHFQNIVHGDIKPQNLLLGDDGIVKIADFGISQMLSGSDEQLHDAGGTPAFMAPELCEGKKNFSGQLADIWAIGASIFMLRFGQPPFVAKSIINLYYKICNDPLVFPNTQIDPGLQNVIEGMLEKNPDKRLTIPQIVAHPWYRQPPPPPFTAAANNPNAPPTAANGNNKGVNNSNNNNNSNNSSNSSSAGRPSTTASASTPASSGSSSTAGATNRPQTSATTAAANSAATAVPTFQPPPSYDAEADEAMKGPIHRTALNNDDVFMSIGNISIAEEEDYEGAIGDVIEEGDDEDSDEEEDDDDNNKDGAATKKSKTKAADKLIGRNRDGMQQQQQSKDDKDASSNAAAAGNKTSKSNPPPTAVAVAEEKRDKLGRKVKVVSQVKEDSSDDDNDGLDEKDTVLVSGSKQQSADQKPSATTAMNTGGSDIMGTNWGADVFQMVEDDGDGRGDDDDDDVDDDDSDEGHDRFDSNQPQYASDGSKPAAGKTITRKESHSEMSEEEEARRSRRFIKKITKKSTDNMMRSLPDSSDKTNTSAVSNAKTKASTMASSTSTTALGHAPTASASAATASSTMSKSQSQPSAFAAPTGGASATSTAGSSSNGLQSLNTSSTNSSPYLKAGSRSARGDPSRTFSMNSTFDDDEPEALTNEEFQAMMDTLSQQNTQGSRFNGQDNMDTIGEVSEKDGGEGLSNRLTTGSSNKPASGPSSAQTTLVGGAHRHNSTSTGTDQNLIDIAMNVVWEQLDCIKVSYINPKLKIGGAFHSEQGIRPTQEDRCVLLPNVAAMQALSAYDLNPGTKEQLNMFALAGIFDGHDGWRSSQYLAQYLATMLVTHDKFLDPKQLNHAINDTFTSIDLQLCDLLREEEDNSGSTAVVAVFDGRKRTLTVAGVGDSLCVLCRNGHAVEMNKMHRITDNASERERVKNAGGTIRNNRVNGVLAVSRSFGDTPFKTLHELQSSLNNPSTAAAAGAPTSQQQAAKATNAAAAASNALQPPVKTNNLKAKIPLHRLVNESLVTAVPEIYTEIITPKTEFALLASDGLWDTMTPQLAISFVREHLSRDKDLRRAAQAVIQEALRRGSIDNITVLILSFNINIQQEA